jgi:hypothetical protein
MILESYLLINIPDRAFKDIKLYLFCLMYSGLSLSLAVAAVFLPTIVGTLGMSRGIVRSDK